jgi:hypothetical protein
MELQEHHAHPAPLVFPLPLQLHLSSRQVSEQSKRSHAMRSVPEHAQNLVSLSQ